ncbi:hypothetical protein [Lysobacter capsici]|uniref:hypothetical protein n=1 Tax=Lysobacter capsici TaxID=435897 RepID=UPI001BFFF099|nr:hypothetical protein [Lysobacter capsici]QWF17782.1 hypothetical protein KME82_03050 [Lysobacter capsici]
MTDTPTIRAVYDPQVVRAWQQALAAHPPLFRRATTVAAIVAVVGLGLNCAPVLHGAFALVLLGSGLAGALLAGLLLALDHERHATDLYCPHCGRNPSGLQRQAADWIDHCVHCLYWLKTPPWIVPPTDDAT